MDRRVVGIGVLVGLLALVGVAIALQPPSTEPSAIKTLAPKPPVATDDAPPAPDGGHVPPKVPPTARISSPDDAPHGSPEAVQAQREAEFHGAITQTVRDNHVECALDAGISTSHFMDIPVAVKGGKVEADCSGVDPDMKGLCGCLEERIEEMAELSIYDGMSWVYPLEIYMKD